MCISTLDPWKHGFVKMKFMNVVVISSGLVMVRCLLGDGSLDGHHNRCFSEGAQRHLVMFLCTYLKLLYISASRCTYQLQDAFFQFYLTSHWIWPVNSFNPNWTSYWEVRHGFADVILKLTFWPLARDLRGLKIKKQLYMLPSYRSWQACDT